MPKISLKQILAQNVKQLRTSHITLNTLDKLGEASGLSHGTIERIEKMQSEAKITSVEALAETFGVDAATLLTYGMQPNEPRSDLIKISQYVDVRGGMGHGVVLQDQPGEIQEWKVTPDWITKNVKTHTGAKNLRIVTGFGDSMRPLYNPGDPLLVDAGIKVVKGEAIYFFRVGEEGFIKRLQRVPGVGIRVISENKSYETWTITPDMDFEVFAVVLKVWCGTDFW